MISPQWSTCLRCVNVGIPPCRCTPNDFFQVIHTLRAAAALGFFRSDPEPR